MRRLRKALTAGLVVASATAGLIPLTSSAAGAAAPLPITCTAAGTLDIVSGVDVSSWKLVGGGSCQGDFEGTYILPNLTANGSSDTIGLCGASGDTVTNLNLSVTGTLVNLANPLQSKTLAGQTWGAPTSTFPVTTPFQISDESGVIGAGNVATRIFGKCPAVGGTPSASVQFAFIP